MLLKKWWASTVWFADAQSMFRIQGGDSRALASSCLLSERLRFGKPRRRTCTCHLSPRFLILAIKTPHHCDRGVTGRDCPANLLTESFRKPNGARGRTRTTDTRIFSPLLYQLSYPGKSPILLGWDLVKGKNSASGYSGS